MAFIRYSHDIGSTALATRLREAEDVLIVPGDQFGLDRYLRMGLGVRADLLKEGLVRLDRVFASLPQRMRASHGRLLSYVPLTGSKAMIAVYRVVEPVRPVKAVRETLCT